MTTANSAGPIVFGTDGWRALIAQDFTFANVRRAADALARLLPDRSPVVVGYDRRFLSEEFARAAAAVLHVRGHRVTLLAEAATTPSLSFSLRKLRCAAGVMITASHNPPSYNGFKVKLPPGCSADEEFTRRLEELVEPEAPVASANGSLKTYSPRKDYLKFLLSKLDRKAWRSPRVRVVFDGMFGSGGACWEDLASALKLKAAVIRSRRDPLFGGLAPEPVEKNLEALKAEVLARKAAVGLAVDGDADRLGVVDDQGHYVPPHHVFPLILLHLVEDRKMTGKVVQAVSLGYLSERIAKHFKLTLVEVPVGFKHVVAHMKQGKVLWGGEESGGYAAGAFAPERDGLLSGLLLLEMVLARGKPLSQLRKDMEARFGASVFQREDHHMRAPISDKKKWTEAVLKHLPAKIAGTPVKETRSLDGLKIVLEDGAWMLLRPSGTEPLMRTYAESADAQKTRQLLAKAQELASVKVPQ